MSRLCRVMALACARGVERRAGCCASLALVAMVWLVPVQPLAAQDIWVATEVELGDEGKQPALAGRVADGLRAKGRDVMSSAAAASEFSRHHSRAAVRPSNEELKQMDDALRELADHLASEDLDKAREVITALNAARPEALDVLNRPADRARRRFQICLLTGHLLAKQGHKSEAFDQVEICAREFPGFEPQRSRYLPSSMREFLAAAQRKLKAIKPSSLTIDVTSPAEGCKALVNGIEAGPIPATVADMRADKVRVQLECGSNLGRIYPVTLKPGKNELRIDPALDDAVVTDNGLKLRYADRTHARELVTAHAAEIGRAVQANVVVAVIGNELRRIDVATKKLSAVALVRSGSFDRAVADLLIRSEDAAFEPPDPGAEPAGRDADPGARARQDLGPPGQDAAGDGPPRDEAPAPSKAPTAKPSQDSSLYATLGWAGVGGTALGAATSIVAWRLRDGAVNRYNECDPDKAPADMSGGAPCDAEYNSYVSSHNLLIGSLVATGVFASVATMFFVLDATRSDHAESPRAKNGCGAGPGDIGVACTLQF